MGRVGVRVFNVRLSRNRFATSRSIIIHLRERLLGGVKKRSKRYVCVDAMRVLNIHTIQSYRHLYISPWLNAIAVAVCKINKKKKNRVEKTFYQFQL